MQVLNASFNQSLDAIPASVQTALKDIVEQIKIQSNFSISHPNYPTIEFPSEIVIRWQQLPSILQNKCLSMLLQDFLYGVYYNGIFKSISSTPEEDTEETTPQSLENNTFLGLDLVFLERLLSKNHSQGYFDPDWLVLKEEQDRSLAVRKDGLTLHIDRDLHLPETSRSATVGDLVAIKLPGNRLENGFYIAIGNSGSANVSSGQRVCLYFNFEPEGALAIMDSLTKKLNELNIPFSFEVLYNPSDYKRYDSGMLYFNKNNYETVRAIVQKAYTDNQSHFQTEIPLFTKFLAPGLGLAEEPDCKFAEDESFGNNRCQIIAHGLLEAWQKGEHSPDSRMAAIMHHFRKSGIDIKQPYLNARSEDIYSSFKLEAV